MSDEPVVDPKGNVMGEPPPEMVPGENFKALPSPPGGRRFADLKSILPPGPPIPMPKLSDYVRNLDGSPLTDEQKRELESHARDLADGTATFITAEDLAPVLPSPPLGVGERPVTPNNNHPPFQLPSGEDESEWYTPTMHTVEQDRSSVEGAALRKRIEASVAASLDEYERTRVEKAKKYLADVSLIADDIVLTVENLVNAFKHKGFTEERAYDLAKLVVEKKLQPFL